MRTRVSQERILNDLIYRKMKKQLEKKFQGMYAVIADGTFIGAEDSLEDAWVLASPYRNAVVTRITKKPLSAKILGSSLRMTTG